MPDEMEKQLAILRGKYMASLPDKIGALRRLWNDAVKEKNIEGLSELHRMAHGLSGSGATFGATHVSQAAKKLEIYIKPFIVDYKIFEAKKTSEVEVLLAGLEGVVSER